MKCPGCGAENAEGMLECVNCGCSIELGSSDSPGRTERHDSIEHLLSRSALREENAFKERLGRRRGILIRSLILPMTIVFRSEIETTSLHVDRRGDVSIRRGAMPKPTFVIEGSHSSICEVLGSREPRLRAPATFKLTLNWGPFRGKTIEVIQGQIMDHPLKDLYGY